MWQMLYVITCKLQHTIHWYYYRPDIIPNHILDSNKYITSPVLIAYKLQHCTIDHYMFAVGW